MRCPKPDQARFEKLFGQEQICLGQNTVVGVFPPMSNSCHSCLNYIFAFQIKAENPHLFPCCDPCGGKKKPQWLQGWFLTELISSSFLPYLCLEGISSCSLQLWLVSQAMSLPSAKRFYLSLSKIKVTGVQLISSPI